VVRNNSKGAICSIFAVSHGWFNGFLSRNDIANLAVTNKAQQPPTEYCEIILKFLCFNRRNSQLRDGMEDTVMQTVMAVGCNLLANILNMDQTLLSGVS